MIEMVEIITMATAIIVGIIYFSLVIIYAPLISNSYH
ncbi:hypothetical protein SAKOR_01687 [Staphylococcus aureus subsp. aureus CN1]|nr:hypothetical protein SAKOR_01687 [Staphylococcus aureus subsp. aureus CN1]BAR09205.1 hypothetical protein SAJPND1_01694 [Staphylococcus aureus]BAR11929.1 hypothetical protein SAJPND4_01694 [Staphylococcus aureus]